jgi:hypothetical protein
MRNPCTKSLKSLIAEPLRNLRNLTCKSLKTLRRQFFAEPLYITTLYINLALRGAHPAAGAAVRLRFAPVMGGAA